jgi:predicted DNA binding CopG/RHH family protein
MYNPKGAATVFGKVDTMRAHYDFSKASKNPYARRLKKQVTIRLTNDAIAYFKDMARQTGVPYQTLIDLYLRDCAAKGRRLSMRWKAIA